MHWNLECNRLWSLCHHPVWLRCLSLWTLDKSQNPIGHCHNCWKAKVLSLISKLFCFLNWSFLLSSKYSKLLQDIEEGKHDDEECEEYCRRYKGMFDQELPDCQFKGNKSKIQSLIRKVQICADGSVTEIKFDNEMSTDQDMKNSKKMDAKNGGTKSLRTKFKNLFKRK